MAEPPHEAPDPRPDGEGRSGATSRFRRPAALVIEAGALAGAILSIVGVVRLFAGDDDGVRATTAAPQRKPALSLAVPAGSVRRITRGDWLVSRGAERDVLDPREFDLSGVTVSYELEIAGYEPGTSLPVQFELLRLTPNGEEKIGTEEWEYAEVKSDPDTCTCPGAFFELPDPAGRYRIVVGVFAPGVMKGEPLKSRPIEFGPLTS